MVWRFQIGWAVWVPLYPICFSIGVLVYPPISLSLSSSTSDWLVSKESHSKCRSIPFGIPFYRYYSSRSSLAFFFRSYGFPWGGAFGQAVSSWLTNFVGVVGMIALIIFVIIIAFTWMFNPNYNEMTTQSLMYRIRSTIDDLISGRYFKKKKKQTKAAPPAALRSAASKKAASATTSAPVGLRPEGSNGTAKEASPAGTPPGEASNGNKETPTEDLVEGQLSFELDENRERIKKQSLKTGGDAELEIAEPTPNAPVEEPAISPVAANLLNNDGRMVIEDENRNHLEPYDPTLDLSSYEYPVVPLLNDYEEQKVEIDRAELEQNKDQIIETLLNYKIEITKIKATIGPTVTLYEIVPAAGVRISKIKNLEDDIALSLAALGIRIIAPIPGKGTIGIEVPNKNKQIVSLKRAFDARALQTR